MVLQAPQITYLAILMVGLGISLNQHGTRKTGENNFWSTLIASGIQMGIMYWGGFFS